MIRLIIPNVLQWNSIAIPLLCQMPETGESPQFSISLPVEAIETIEKKLIPYAFYGRKRATICRALILEKLRELYPPHSPSVAADRSSGETQGE